MADKCFMIVSVPERERGFTRIQSAITQLARITSFAVPELKVGTLDALMSLSDDLLRHDGYVDGGLSPLSPARVPRSRRMQAS